MAWEQRDFVLNFITVPMQGNKVGLGEGLGKFRRNLVMFRGLFPGFVGHRNNQKLSRMVVVGEGFGEHLEQNKSKGQRESKE